MKILSENAKEYSKWVDELESNPDIHLVVDDTPYTYPRDALKALTAFRRIAIGIGFVSFVTIILDFFYGRELSTWGINYAGDFIRLIPTILE